MNDSLLTSRAQAAVREAVVPARASILLVDDKPARLLTYEAILQGLEVNCVRAHSGTEALEKLMAQEFAVVLLDVQMPDIDGFEVARLVRQHPRLERMPIIFVTGVNVGQLDVLRGYEVGAIDYIAVPVVPEILRSKVAVLIELYQRRAELQRLNAELAAARAQLADEFSRDTADHRRTEAALRDSERVFKALVENATVGVARNTLAGKFLYTNPGFCQMVGYSAEELAQMTWQQITHPDDVEIDVAQAKRVISGEAASYLIEKRYIRKDGEIVWVSLHGSFVRSDDDKSMTGMAVIVDITERKRADEELRAADRRKDEFLAMLAHELRNPVAPILSVAEALTHLAGRDERQQALAGIVQRQASHLSRLLDDLLDVARITQGRMVLQCRTESVVSLVADAVDAVRPAVDAARHVLEVHLPPESLQVHADATRVAQALLNLLNNAVKFTPDGGRIDVTVRRVGTHAEIAVQDTGIGISAEDRERIFGMFIQDHETLGRRQGGLGIGLALARKVIEMHGGSVTAQSPGHGRGSTFTIALPLREAPPHEVAARGPAPAAGRRRRVLVVDDSPDGLESLRVMLELQGHEVGVAATGRQALEEAAAQRFELVLLDIGLPDIDGYRVARELQSRCGTGVPVLAAVTGWGQPSDLKRSTEAGFARHFTKPVDPYELEAFIEGLQG